MKRLVYALDIVDDPEVIERYKEYHRSVPEDVLKNLSDKGLVKMEIFLIGNRLINIIDVPDDYDSGNMKREKVHPKVKEWEVLMGRMQKPLDEAAAGEKWVLMEKIYERGGTSLKHSTRTKNTAE